MANLTDKEIEYFLAHPDTLSPLRKRGNDYGETHVITTMEKIQFAAEIAHSFGFDETIAIGIQAISELASPCYGSVGDAFLQKIDPDYTRALYGKRLAAKLLHRFDSDKIPAICSGVENVLLGIDRTAEEKIVRILNYSSDFADSLKERDIAGVFVFKYKDLIIKKTADSGKLTGHIIPPNNHPRRAPVKYSEEELQRQASVLEKRYADCLKNPQLIPEDFRRGWGDLDEKIVASYYVANGPEDTSLKPNFIA